MTDDELWEFSNEILNIAHDEGGGDTPPFFAVFGMYIASLGIHREQLRQEVYNVRNSDQ